MSSHLDRWPSNGSKAYTCISGLKTFLNSGFACDNLILLRVYFRQTCTVFVWSRLCKRGQVAIRNDTSIMRSMQYCRGRFWWKFHLSLLVDFRYATTTFVSLHWTSNSLSSDQWRCSCRKLVLLPYVGGTAQDCAYQPVPWSISSRRFPFSDASQSE